MLVIEAIALRGKPLPEPLRATFDEAGGTIGRAGASTLALPDPERRISRTHATIGFDARGFVLTDTGSFNRLALNGRSLSGGRAYLKDGDKLTVGSYRLLVFVGGAVSAPAQPQTLPTPTLDEPAANPEAALSSPASSTIPADAPEDGSPAASLPAGIALEQEAPHTQAGAAEEDPPAAAQDHLPAKPTKELDLIFKSGDARIEPYLPNELIVSRPALPEPDVLGLYPFLPLDSAPECISEIGDEPPAALPRGEPPVLTSVWDPDDEEDVADTSDASEATVYAGTPMPGAVAAGARGLTVHQLAAILHGAGVSGITPESLEIIGRVLRESVQGAADAPPAGPRGGTAQSRAAKRRGQGFTTPIHHRGILVGVRGAFSDIAGRLSPHRLETWLKRKSPLASLLPTHH